MPHSSRLTHRLTAIDGGGEGARREDWDHAQKGFLLGMLAAIKGGRWEAGLSILEGESFKRLFSGIRERRHEGPLIHQEFNDGIHFICRHFLDRILGQAEEPFPKDQVAKAASALRHFLIELKALSGSEHERYIDALLEEIESLDLLAGRDRIARIVSAE